MSRFYRRREPDSGETLAAAAVAAGVGAATFWLVRTLLARDSLEQPSRRAPGPDAESSAPPSGASEVE